MYFFLNILHVYTYMDSFKKHSYLLCKTKISENRFFFISQNPHIART